MEAEKIINEMCRLSPIQKAWKPRPYDHTNKGTVVFECKNECLIFNGQDYTRIFDNKDLWLIPTQGWWQKLYWDNVGGPVEMCEPGIETVCNQLVEIEKTFGELSTWESSDDVTTRAAIVPGLNALSYPKTFTLLWCILVHQNVMMDWPWGKSTADWNWNELKWVKK